MPLYNIVRTLDRREGKWQSLTITFTTPELEKPNLSLQLVVLLATSGKVWFDNVELFESRP